jgi:hypothetical protein
MDKRTVIKAALCIVAAVASTSAVSGQLRPNLAESPTGDVWPTPGEQTRAPRRAAPPIGADDLGPLPGNVILQNDEVRPEEMKTPLWKIKVDITLTMRRPQAAAGTHRSHRSCK